MIYFLDLKNGATEFINPVTSFKAYLHDISFEHAVFLIFSPIIPWFVTFGFTTITWQIPRILKYILPKDFTDQCMMASSF